jgi:general secretion pathway protein F
MTAYRYKALDRDGKSVTGLLESDSERQARSVLRSQGLKPLQIDRSADNSLVPFSLASLIRPVRRLSVAQLSLLSRQMASLVQSGLPLDEVLQICARQSRHVGVQTILSQVRSRVMEGHSLAQAMAEHPAAFDRMYCAMVRAGESAGFLGEVLERLAEYTESSHQSRQKIKLAMIYPMVLLGVSLLVVMLLMVFVVPRLVGMFASSNRELPLLTRVLIESSDFLSSVWALLLFVLFAVAVVGFKWWLRDSRNRASWHRIILQLPLVGENLRQIDSARFASTMAILLGSGVPLLQSVRIAGQVLDNEIIRQHTDEIATSVQEGGSFSKSLRQAGIFPPLLEQMAANGEANGTLGIQLAYAAANQERELSMRMGTTMALLEPLTIVLMGGLVTLIMLAVLLPIFDINTLI